MIVEQNGEERSDVARDTHCIRRCSECIAMGDATIHSNVPQCLKVTGRVLELVMNEEDACC
jgi:hypothetical protein